jgi:hypothetical protein
MKGRMNPRASLAGLAFLALLVALSLAVVRPGGASPGDPLPSAVQKGTRFLATDVVQWSEGVPRTYCAACHRHGISLFGLSQAKLHGYDVTTPLGDERVDAVEYIAQVIARTQQGDGRWHTDAGAAVSTTSYALFGAAGYDLYVSNGALASTMIRGADWAIPRQEPDGQWYEDNGGYRPPDWGTVATTARMMIGIAQARTHLPAGDARLATYASALNRGLGWLLERINDPDNSNGQGNDDLMDQTYKVGYGILGLAAAGKTVANSADARFLRDRLLGQISTVTGSAWGAASDVPADSFDTGVALLALFTAGLDLTDTRITDAQAWLNETQIDDVSYGTGGAYWEDGGARDTRTAFALLGLTVFGEGVQLRMDGARAMEPDLPTRQTATFHLTVRNANASGRADTYSLRVRPPLPGWTAVLERSSVTLNAGASEVLNLTVTSATDLEDGTSVSVVVTAQSQANSAIGASASALVHVGRDLAPPPDTGDATTTTLVAPGTPVNVGEPYTFTATILDQVTGEPVHGPAAGIMTFAVDGATIGYDRDADGDGSFRFTWTAPSDWFPRGRNELRASFSGVDRPEPPDEHGPDLQPSSDSVRFELRAGTLRLLSIDPPSGQQGEKVDVTLTGDGFTANSRPGFGSGTSVAVLSTTDTQIRARLTIDPAAPVTTRDVTVTDGGRSAALRNAFSVLIADAPALTGVSPNRGRRGERLTVTLAGSKFLAGAQVSLGAGITLTGAPQVSASEIVVGIEIAGSAALGDRTVTVTNPNGLASSKEHAFTLDPAAPPVIQSLTPDHGAPGSRLSLVIRGEAFQPSAEVVLGAGLTRTNTPTVTSTEIRVGVAVDVKAPAGPVEVVVRNPDLQTATATLTVDPPPAGPPTLTSVSPATGKQGERLRVTLHGAGFQEGATASFAAGISVVGMPTFISSEELEADIRISATTRPGPRRVVVLNPDGQIGARTSAFKVVAGEFPVLTLDRTSVRFPDVQVAKDGKPRGSSKAVVTVTNTGRAGLEVTPRAPKAPFSLSPGTALFTLEPGKKRRVVLFFSPRKKGSFKGRLVLRSNDPKKPTVTLPLKGQAR